MYLEATLRNDHKCIRIEQRSHHMRSLISRRACNKTAILPLHKGTYIMAPHRTITDAVFHDHIDQGLDQACMTQHLAYKRTPEERKGYRSEERRVGKEC